MDQLSTYALVAALKEITKKSNQPPATNERWISLRSCMTDIEKQPLDIPETTAQAAPVPDEPPLPNPTPPAALPAPRKSFRHIQAINQRHMTARNRQG